MKSFDLAIKTEVNEVKFSKPANKSYTSVVVLDNDNNFHEIDVSPQRQKKLKNYTKYSTGENLHTEKRNLRDEKA